MTFDAIVVGAGPAGLTAAIYLARFRRRFLVVHNADSRAAWIPRTRNHPGFPGGVGGPDLLDRMARQAAEYGSEIRHGEAQALRQVADGFEIMIDGVGHAASTVLLATGVVDNTPALAGVAEAIRAGVLRICPICDGFEIANRSVAVISDSALGVREADFLRTYSDDVTLIHLGPAAALERDARAQLAQSGIALVETGLDQLTLEGEGLRMLGPQGRSFALVYSALGVVARTGLAQQAGVTLAQDGRLIVDDHQQTSIPGLFAAGDMVRGLNQISTAQAEAAIAATAIHNRLRQSV